MSVRAELAPLFKHVSKQGQAQGFGTFKSTPAFSL